jgi:hypothetical protein
MLNELKSGTSFDETAVTHLESILNMRFAQGSKVKSFANPSMNSTVLSYEAA